MTTMVSREEVHDELYKLVGQHRAAAIPRLMKVIDAYAIGMARRSGPVDWRPDPYKYLKPGEADPEARKRRCAACGKVKNLDRDFGRDYRAAEGRRVKCLECSPNKHLVSVYWCPGCRERLPLEKYGENKHKNPRRTFKCIMCEATK